MAKRDIDISNRRSAPGLGWIGWRTNVVLWGGVLLLVFVLYYIEASTLWPYLAIVAAMVLGLFAWLLWRLVFTRGRFTWMRLAQLPVKTMARGDAAGAEAAFVRGRARAHHFAADDPRRGLMLCELAMYVKNQGRYPEAVAMYEESAAILAQHLATAPLDYFVVLNNYAICHIHLRDFNPAQKHLEKALDLTLAARKHEATRAVQIPLSKVQWLQFVLHLNLAFLFLEMHELTEADWQLREADALAPLLSKRMKTNWQDHYVGLCATWEFESGHLGRAEKELAEAKDPDYPACLRIRAKVALARQQFAQAEQHLRKYQEGERKKGPLHRPELFKVALELAECLFGLGKPEEAIAALQESRSIVVNFALPADDAWRKALATWLQRAKDLGRTELAASLEKELAQVSATPVQAITILEKFRIQTQIG